MEAPLRCTLPLITLTLPPFHPHCNVQTFIYYHLRAEGLIYFRAAKAIYASLAITGINVLKFSFKLWKVSPPWDFSDSRNEGPARGPA